MVDGERNVNLDPLMNAPGMIPSHAIVAMLAIVTGGAQLAMPKGTPIHRALGLLWVTGMAFVAISGLFIHTLKMIGLFSPIHLLSFVVLVSLWIAIRAAKAGDITTHRKVMVWLYVLALVVTGAFTFYPGRIMYQVVFGG